MDEVHSILFPSIDELPKAVHLGTIKRKVLRIKKQRNTRNPALEKQGKRINHSGYKECLEETDMVERETVAMESNFLNSLPCADPRNSNFINSYARVNQVF